MSTKIKNTKKRLKLLLAFIPIISLVIIAYITLNGSLKEKLSNELKFENDSEMLEMQKEELENNELNSNSKNEEPIDNENETEKLNTNDLNNSIKENSSNNEEHITTTTNNNNSNNNNVDQSKNDNNIIDITQNDSNTKEQTAWEKLGISEYDYYNAPAWKWQTVDFGINLDESKYCSNENDCLLKCQEYGEEYLKTHSGGFKCNNVFSHSGDYLGEDFEFFELQP